MRAGAALGLVAGLACWGAAAVAAQVPLSRDPAQLRAGRLLYATPGMGDPRFAEAVVLLITHDREGSAGVVINQPSEVSLRKALPDLPEARRSELPVYWGGPVQPEVTIVLLREPGTGQRAERVLPGVYLSRDLDDLRAVLAAPRPDRAVRIYSGYAGWSPGQLASEMQKNQWVLDEGDAAQVFSPDPTRLWERVHAILARREARSHPVRLPAGASALSQLSWSGDVLSIASAGSTSSSSSATASRPWTGAVLKTSLPASAPGRGVPIAPATRTPRAAPPRRPSSSLPQSDPN